MNRSFEQRTWRNAGIAAAFALCLVPTASQAADVDDLADKLDRVERDLRDLQYDVYKGNPPSPPFDPPRAETVPNARVTSSAQKM